MQGYLRGQMLAYGPGPSVSDPNSLVHAAAGGGVFRNKGLGSGVVSVFRLNGGTMFAHDRAPSMCVSRGWCRVGVGSASGALSWFWCRLVRRGRRPEGREGGGFSGLCGVGWSWQVAPEFRRFLFFF